MILIKIGGRFAENDLLIASLADELASLHNDGERMLLVHGGGTTVSALQDRFGLTPNFIHGLRQTPPEEMPLVDMALAGAVNKRLVRLFHSRGIAAWGLCGADGATLTGKSMPSGGKSNRTGVVTDISTQSVELLWKEHFFPILAPPAMDASGMALNINADDAALAMAKALGASHLIFLSDVPGVLQSGEVIAEMTPADTDKLIEEGTVTGGMIPKLKASAAALEASVGAVSIAAYQEYGDLDRILAGQRGTRIVRAKAETTNPPLPKQYGDKLLVFEHGEGCRLYDKSGREYLDLGAGIAVNALGYGRQDLAEIAFEQMTKLVHVSNLFTTGPQIALAEKMVAAGIPGSSQNTFEAVHFGNSGTEANETALKYARLYALARRGPGHHRFISFTDSFHGRTMGALSLTANQAYRTPFNPLIPDCEILPFNDVQALKDGLDETAAAVIVEPIQGEGGLKQLTGEFAQALNTLCRNNDVLLIADEVQTGLGRCGTLFASELTGLEPDIITLAKPLAGGLPLSATLIPAKVNALLKPGHHASTFGGGPVTTQVAARVWDILSAPEFLAEVKRKGELAANLLKQGYADIPVEVRGAGLLRGLRLNSEKYDGAWCGKIIETMRDRGVIILKTGADVLRLAPPLIITDKDLELGITALFEVVMENI